MKTILYLSTVVLVLNSLLLAQDEIDHRWKKLDANSDEEIWFDVSSLDSLKGNNFEVWLLQVHRPPMKSEGIDGDIYRSKIMYAVNLATVRYGIMKLRYYDVKNSELYRFDYDTPPPPTDALKYPYPVLEESPVYLIIKNLFGNEKEQGM
jgi:hypothetical protein